MNKVNQSSNVTSAALRSSWNSSLSNIRERLMRQRRIFHVISAEPPSLLRAKSIDTNERPTWAIYGYVVFARRITDAGSKFETIKEPQSNAMRN